VKTYFWGFCAIWIAAIGLAECKGWDDVPAEAITPSADYPCGIIGVPCYEADGGFSHTCCWGGETCGGSPGCPVGVCCNVRAFDPYAYVAGSRDGGGILPAPTNGHMAAIDGGVVWVRTVGPETRVP
jgi:hypothetical protein